MAENTVNLRESTLRNLVALSGILGQDITETIDNFSVDRLCSLLEIAEVGDYVLFTGWYEDRHIYNRLAQIIDIDDLSSVSDSSDRYTIKFISSGDKEDCTRSSLSVVH